MNTRGLFKLTARMSSIGSIESRTVVFIHDPIIAHHRITGAQRRCLAHGSGCTRLLDWVGYDLSFEMFPRHLGIMVCGASYEYYFVLVAVESRMSLTVLGLCTAKSRLMQRKNTWFRDRCTSMY